MKKHFRMSKSKSVLLIAFAFLFIMIVFISVFLICTFTEYEHKMFSDINMINIPEDYVIEGIPYDKCLKNIQPIEKYTKIVLWNDKEYYICAYEFENTEDSKEYAYNLMPAKNKYRGNSDYREVSTIFFVTDYVAYYENKIIFIRGSDIKSMHEFMEWLTTDWDIVL